jgi:hypothetical protein
LLPISPLFLTDSRQNLLLDQERIRMVYRFRGMIMNGSARPAACRFGQRARSQLIEPEGRKTCR